MVNEYLGELKQLLKSATDGQRAAMEKIVGAGYGNQPGKLCDHMNYLWNGTLGQHVHPVIDMVTKTLGWHGARKSDYKQLVTDVADKIGINWSALLSGRDWKNLSSAEIEGAVVLKVFEGLYNDLPPDKQRELAEAIAADAKNPNLIPELLAGGAILLAQAGGFTTYVLASTSVGLISSALGFTLPFAFFTTMSSAIALAIGPFGVSIVAVPFILKGFQTDWQKLIAGVLWCSVIRNSGATQ